MKPSRYDVNKANQRCSKWLQNPHNHHADDAMEEDDPDDPLSDHFRDSIIYSAEEDLSNQSRIGRRCKKKSPEDESFSELSEVSQDAYKNSRIYPINDAETDVSLTSEDVSVRKPKSLFIKDKKFELVCGWQNCTFESSDVDLFVEHVADHVPHLRVKRSEEDNEEVYLCQWESCDFETPNDDEVIRHVNFHSYHTKAKFIGSLVCQKEQLPECSHDGAGKNLVPDLPQPLQCLWNKCSITSNNPNYFYRHVHEHTFEIPTNNAKIPPEKKHKCLWQGCKTLVKHRAKMAEHLPSHTKERVVACPTCGVLYASRQKLIDHIKRQMTSEESMTYQCTHCSRSYPSERILRDHMRHHVNHFKCQFCDMTCPTQYALSNHIRFRHLDEKPFACDYCDYRAKTQYNLRRHMAIHSTVDNFSCEEDDCNFTCRTLSILNWHYRKKHDAPPVYCCHMCATKFARGAYLTQHLMRKHNFRWPSGHTRFRFYKNHEDGLFRLQTVRYESLDVVEDINRQEGEPSSVLHKTSRFKVSKASDDGFVANFVVQEEDDNPDDPDYADDHTDACAQSGHTPEKAPQSMPSLDCDISPMSKKVLISIDEVDKDGNIISSKTMEVDELLDMEEAENALIVADGVQIDNLSS
ncbi:Histone H4 transcription factor [Frankliniella fusca]|uniref:Histone H4 transcription factor n=1 Tax=Frankliniella fusca TaxID=407009 RepID=A0AAE1H715_9NEOP|nr:Histone H4 transcription factor [Frankliniella fusca]